MGGTVVKPNVRKTRKIGEHAIGGFAGKPAAPLSSAWCRARRRRRAAAWRKRRSLYVAQMTFSALLPCAFAGATADAFTLFERLETKLEEHPGEAAAPAKCCHIPVARVVCCAMAECMKQVMLPCPYVTQPPCALQGSSRARRWSSPRCGGWTSICGGWM